MRLKTFKDLKFEKSNQWGGERALMEFANGYGVLVGCGYGYYSKDGNYGLVVMKDGRVCRDSGVTENGIVGDIWQGAVTEFMRLVQELKIRSKK